MVVEAGISRSRGWGEVHKWLCAGCGLGKEGREKREGKGEGRGGTECLFFYLFLPVRICVAYEYSVVFLYKGGQLA